MSQTIKTDILISGGGAVGLFLGVRLRQLGLDCRVIEQKTHRSTHSRSIGIHPPSLEYLQKMNLVESFISQGRRIPKGLAIGDHGLIGELDFASCKPPFSYILTLPQYQTERILEHHLNRYFPDTLLTGKQLMNFTDYGKSIDAEIKGTDGKSLNIITKFLIGCDGKNSAVRDILDIKYTGGAYPDTFIMGDFDDTTPFGSTAAIYLQREGLIESFPLPENKRRWVIRTPEYIPVPTAGQLADVIELRTGFSIPTGTNSMISSFGVQHYVASSFGKGRAGIIGDAAHIVSPFGGQGMNLGWMDAWELADILYPLRHTGYKDFPWNTFSLKRRFAAWQAIKRAEFNMNMGREHHNPQLYEALIKSLLFLPTKKILPKLFTMRWL